MAEITQLGHFKTRTYPAYQFIAYLRYDGHTAEECMHYSILTVMAWIRDELGGTDLPEELAAPDSSEFMNVKPEQLVSFHFHGSVCLDITSLLEEGKWALRFRAPDLGTGALKAVPGRCFETDVAFRLDADRVFFAVRLHVNEPLECASEAESVLRPAFMRELFRNKKLRITQVDLLRFDESYSVNNSHGLRHMLDVIESPDNYMPSLIFTYAVQKRKVIDIIDSIDEALNLNGTETSFRNHLSVCSLLPDFLEIGQPFLPYDANRIARHSFGYGRVYQIEPNQFSAFQTHLGNDVQMGDILWVEPVRFGGERKIIPYRAEEGPAAREAIETGLLDAVHRYSRSKLYDYSVVQFETSLRRRKTESHILEMLDDMHQNVQAETDAIYSEMGQLLELTDTEKDQAQKELEKARIENQNLAAVIRSLHTRLRAAKEEGVLHLPDIREFYADEQYDLVISILMDAMKHHVKDHSRAYELLEGILSMNPLSGEGKMLFEEAKSILHGKNRLTEEDKEHLRMLGFTCTEESSGTYKLVFQNDERYALTYQSPSEDIGDMPEISRAIDETWSVYQ